VDPPRVIRVAQNPGEARKSAIERAILVAQAGSAAVYQLGLKRKGLRISIGVRNPFTFVSTKTERAFPWP
jgi:hypothetical protein